MNTTWAVSYKALFGRRLLDEDVAEWERLLDGAFKRGTDRTWTAELLPALEGIAETQRQAGRGKHAPDFTEVKSAIIKTRFQKAGNNRPPADKLADDPDCPFCRDTGAMQWYPEIKPPYPTTLEPYMCKVRVEQIFCFCGKGQSAARDAHCNVNTTAMRRAQQEAGEQFQAKMGIESEPAGIEPEEFAPVAARKDQAPEWHREE